MIIRPCGEADLDRVAALWNAAIRDTLITFTTKEKTADDMRALYAACAAADHGFLVAEQDGEVAGFATYGQFRAGPGYAHTMEHTVILGESARGQGIGRALMAELEAHARARGVRVMVAGLSGTNVEGCAFHQALGYREVGRLPEAGFKHGRWLDLILMQKTLLDPDTA